MNKFIVTYNKHYTGKILDVFNNCIGNYIEAPNSEIAIAKGVHYLTKQIRNNGFECNIFFDALTNYEYEIHIFINGILIEEYYGFQAVQIIRSDRNEKI